MATPIPAPEPDPVFAAAARLLRGRRPRRGRPRGAPAGPVPALVRRRGRRRAPRAQRHGPRHRRRRRRTRRPAPCCSSRPTRAASCSTRTTPRARRPSWPAGRAALLFPWHPMHRQVGVRGLVEKVSREESAAYFATRPWGSRIGAWASRQSAVVAGRERARGRGGASSRTLAGPRPARRRPAAGALGRLPGPPGRGRVLAGPAVAAARPARATCPHGSRRGRRAAALDDPDGLAGGAPPAVSPACRTRGRPVPEAAPAPHASGLSGACLPPPRRR